MFVPDFEKVYLIDNIYHVTASQASPKQNIIQLERHLLDDE